METYTALTLLSLADGAYVAPGEAVELSPEAAAILLAQGAVAVPGMARIAEAMDAADMTADDLADGMPTPPTPPATA